MFSPRIAKKQITELSHNYLTASWCLSGKLTILVNTPCLKWTSTLNLMIRKKWYNIKSGFPQTGKESLNDLKIGWHPSWKMDFLSKFTYRGSYFLSPIIVNLMLHEIHQHSYILPDMSQLNPKYFWIWLTSLENTLMLIFKHEVKIFSILFNFSSNGSSHIPFFDIWCRNNLILQKNTPVKRKDQLISSVC